MALQSSHGRSSCIRSDQQGPDDGRTALFAYAFRNASPEAAALARSACQATGAGRLSRCGGKSVRYRILVVEDNPLNRELLCDWLEAEGHEVGNVEDLTGAMRSTEERPPAGGFREVQLVAREGLY